MKNIVRSIVFLLLTQTMSAQSIVSLDPAFPTGDDAVTLTYNADQGNAALANLPITSAIYAHIGLKINNATWQYVVGNWGTADARVLMTRIGTSNQYTLSLTSTLRQWFTDNCNSGSTVPADALIQQLCVVFRNADGSLQGKTSSNSDIFVDLATTSFSASITSHPQSNLLINANQTIVFTGQSSSNAELGFLLDGIVSQTQQDTNRLDFSLNSNSLSPGLHTLIFSANNGTTTLHDTILITLHAPTQTAATPSYGEEGIMYPTNTKVYLQLRAPFKDFIYVLGDFNNWTILPEYQMKRTPDGQYFWIEISNLDPNQEYRFQYYIDWEGLRVTDPYSEKVIDPWNDQWISPNTYPNLLPYPTGKGEGVVGVLQSQPTPYNWDNTYTYNRPPKEDLVVYELLVRDFSTARTFTEIINRLPYLGALGVNAIELMPVAEFDGNDSWGYNPNFFMAVDKSYGTRNELKRLVDSCHARGIAVISDVVFNHSWGLNPMVQMYFDGSTNQTTSQSPWFNPIATHPFSVGTDFNHESQATKFFVKKVLKHWLQEYKIDGFRFDLSKGFTQNNTGSDIGAWSAYDQSRINILLDYAASIRQTESSAYIILEHLGVVSEETVYANNGLMLWGKATDVYNEATMGWLNGQSQNLYNTTAQSKGWNNYGLMSYMESHDEERLMYKNLQFGNVSGSYSTKDLNTALDRMGEAAAFFIPIPGPKMIWQFGELGYGISINQCPNGTVSADCRTSAKPVYWNYYDNPNRRDLFNTYSKLIYLKTHYPVFRDLGVGMDLGQYSKWLRFDSNTLDAVIAGNFNVVSGSVTVNFTQTGKWYDYLSGDSINVSNTNTTLNYQAGEFHVYLNQRIIPPANTYTGNPTGIESPTSDAAIQVYPNPFTNEVNITLPIQNNSTAQLELIDMAGRAVWKQTIVGSNSITIPGSELPQGMYFCRVILSGKTFTTKIIKH
ncbi:MAG: hypothetical protein RLZZ543_1193 [Bacteroidota bacterium]